MFSRIVIKTLVLTTVFVMVVGCGQKGPLKPAPMPEKNNAEPTSVREVASGGDALPLEARDSYDNLIRSEQSLDKDYI